MAVRLFALMIAAFCVMMWAMCLDSMSFTRHPSAVAEVAVHVFFGSALVVCLYGVVTGRAPG